MAICTPNCSVLQPLLQPACVLLFVGKCSPSGPCPPAECPRKSCSINAEVHISSASEDATVKMLACEKESVNAATEKCCCVQGAA